MTPDVVAYLASGLAVVVGSIVAWLAKSAAASAAEKLEDLDKRVRQLELSAAKAPTDAEFKALELRIVADIKEAVRDLKEDIRSLRAAIEVRE